MTELLAIYKWNILASAIIAPALALIGVQTLARGWGTRTLVVSQASSTGTIIGILLTAATGLADLDDHGGESLIGFFSVFLSGIVVASAVGLWTEIRDSRKNSSASAFDSSIAIYVVLICISSAITALSPNLEAHMSAAFIGDLSTASNLEARVGLALGLGTLGWMWWKWRDLSRGAFLYSVFLERPVSMNDRKTAWIFNGLIVFALALAMQSLGLIFVLGSLFVPQAIMLFASTEKTRLSTYRNLVATTAIFGSIAGFIVSLRFTDLPTTPTIVFFQVFAGVILAFSNRLIRR